MYRRTHRRGTRERGSVAVEFALLLPLLMLLICGVIDFGRMLNAQLAATQTAREDARLLSVGVTNSQTLQEAAPGLLNGVTLTYNTCPAGVTPGTTATVNVSYPYTFITPISVVTAMFGHGSLGSGLTITAEAVAPCET